MNYVASENSDENFLFDRVCLESV